MLFVARGIISCLEWLLCVPNRRLSKFIENMNAMCSTQLASQFSKKNPNCYYTLLLHLYSGRSGIVSRVFNVCYRARKPLFVPCGLWCIGYGRTFTFAPICEAAIAACVLLHPLYILNSNRFSMKFFCSDLFDSKHTLLARLQSRSSRACQKMICIEK